MALLKTKEIREMGKENREKKLKELKLELVKSKANVSKKGSAKTKEIKKIIARILTINKSQEPKKKSGIREELNKT